MAAADLMVDHSQIPVEINNGRNLLKAAAVDNRLVPNVSIVCVVQVMLLDNPESHFCLAAIALDIYKELLRPRTLGTLPFSSEQLLKKSHTTILLGLRTRAKTLDPVWVAKLP